MSTDDAIPLGLISISSFRPYLRSLLFTHTLLTLLVPLFIALLYYSTAHAWRQPIFILNVVVITMAFSIGVLADFAGVHFILSPEETLSPWVWVSSALIGIFQSILVDLILLFRLISVYPLARIGLRRFALVSGLPILLKVVRLINLLIFLEIMVNLVKKDGIDAIYTYFSVPCLKVEWVTQVVDNSYASIMFLRAIQGRGPSSRGLSGCSLSVQPRLPNRLRSLFRIALSNFVIPTVFSIFQLVVVVVAGGGLFVGDVVYANGMLSVYGVVFASVWAGKENRRSLEEEKQIWRSNGRDRNRAPNGTDFMSFSVEATQPEAGLPSGADGDKPSV